MASKRRKIMEATKPVTELAPPPTIDWKELDGLDESHVEEKPIEVTEPVTESVKPVVEPAHPEDALDAQFDALMEKDPPVSLSPEPIKLQEPEDQRLQTIQMGDVTIMATPERIELVRQAVAPESIKPVEPPPIAQKVYDKTVAEMAAGRNALGRHVQRSQLFPRPTPTAAELARETGSTQIINGDNHPLQHLLNKPAVPGKGPGY